MITTNVKINVETSFKPEESTKFKVNTSNADLLAEYLRDTLYADVPSSIVREILSNCLDANKEAKTTRKAQIEYVEENLLNGEFAKLIFRDFGNGMSDEFIRTRYVSYLDSTKKDNNNFIGGYGIGSKSLFAYGSQYEIITKTINESTARHYVAYIDADNICTINMLDSITLAEGVECLTEIILPINNYSDVRIFNRAIDHYVTPINDKVELINVDHILDKRFLSNNILYSDNDFQIYKAYHPYLGNSRYLIKTISIMLGDVYYRLEISDYNELVNYLDSANKLNNFCRANGIIFKFNVGELSVSLSREKIRNNKANIDAIIAKINNAYICIGKMYQQKMEYLFTDKTYIEKNMLAFQKNQQKNQSTDDYESLELLFIKCGKSFLDNTFINDSKLPTIIKTIEHSIESATIKLYNKATGIKAISIHSYDVNHNRFGNRNRYSLNNIRTCLPYINEIQNYYENKTYKNRKATTKDLYAKLGYDTILGYVFCISTNPYKKCCIILTDHTISTSDSDKIFKVLYSLDNNNRNLIFINTNGLQKYCRILRYLNMTYNADYLLSLYDENANYILSNEEHDIAIKEELKLKQKQYARTIRVKKAAGTVSVGIPNFYKNKNEEISSITYTPTIVNVNNLMKHDKIIYGSTKDADKLSKFSSVYNRLIRNIDDDVTKESNVSSELDKYRFLIIKANQDVQNLAKKNNNFIHIDEISIKHSFISELHGNYNLVRSTGFIDTLNKYMRTVLYHLNNCDITFNLSYKEIISNYECLWKNKSGYSRDFNIFDKNLIPKHSDHFAKLLEYCNTILNKFAFLQTTHNYHYSELYGNNEYCNIINSNEFNLFLTHYIKNDAVHSK